MRRILLVALSLGAVEPLAGQEPISLSVGKRVRVHTLSPAGRYDHGVDGTLELLARDSVVIRTRPWGELQTIQTNKDTRYLVHLGRRSSLLRGSVIGLTTGVISAAAVWSIKGKQCPGEKFTCNSREQLFLEGGAIFAAVGAIIGGSIGAFLPHNLWAPAGPGPALSLSFRF